MESDAGFFIAEITCQLEVVLAESFGFKKSASPIPQLPGLSTSFRLEKSTTTGVITGSPSMVRLDASSIEEDLPQHPTTHTMAPGASLAQKGPNGSGWPIFFLARQPEHLCFLIACIWTRFATLEIPSEKQDDPQD
tara:strand:- start:329 stop:736 length:408 start_codon:yes stop_codon:yes gene_type:complete